MDIQNELKKELAERHEEFESITDNICKSNLGDYTPEQRQFVFNCVMAGAGVAIGGLGRFLEKIKQKSL